MLLQIKLCLFAPSLKINVMAKSKMVHDYSKPAKVSNLLYRVYHLLGSDSSCDIADAREVIVSARTLLDDYLASDNLIPDDDE